MGPRLQRISGEVARFTAVNGLATFVALVLFNALVHGVPGLFGGPMHGRPLTSYFLANSVGMVVSYSGSKRFAFKHRQAVGPGDGALNYVVINLVSFVIPISCLWVSRNVLHYDDALSDNISGNAVGALLGTVFRFWMFRTFVFTAHRALSGEDAGAVVHLPQVGVHLAAHDTGTWPVVHPSAAPELRPLEAELLEHQAEEREAETHDVVRISRDTRNEGTA
jgi:putative flippase GtrA